MLRGQVAIVTEAKDLKLIAAFSAVQNKIIPCKILRIFKLMKIVYGHINSLIVLHNNLKAL